jgi:2-succinyl-5-enolpyruvyl-6-hydroxy-3-cyclohexene-1-carboxylate synthase
MTATDTYVLLRAFCDELARCGVEHAATSPGSRNAPLVLSLYRQRRIRCWSHLDERCAGFFALGAAKASGRPVAVTCTSGTAAANLMPAVIEAHHARVPLLVLTADRPPELRDVGAGQAIDQLKLYGDAVKWFFEVGVHDASVERLRWMRTLACRAYQTALDRPAGPVHLNFPLREPLVADEPLPEDESGRAGGQPYVVCEPTEPPPAASGPGPHPAGRLLVVAGAGTPDPAGLASFASRASIPLLADPLAAARRGPAAVAHYDLLLRDPAFTAAHRPDFIFRLGELPTSKPLRSWLASLPDVPQIAFDPDRSWRDPDAVVGMRLLSRLPEPEGLEAERGWLRSWRTADDNAQAAIEDTIGTTLSEPLVAKVLTEQLASRATLYAASSMPIRDLETFQPIRDDPPTVLANRGANGIDGTVSSAFGAAAVAAPDDPVVLLTGDLALLHDLGGLLAAKRHKLRITIVVLNNDGGGIFHFLPIATQTDAFEEHVATPHGLDLKRVAELFDLAYARPETAAAFREAMQTAGIVEIRTDRAENLALHRRIAEAVLNQPAAAAAPRA